MNKGTQHRMMVDGMLNTPAEFRGKGYDKLLQYLRSIAPAASSEDIALAMEDAAGILEDHAAVADAQVAAMKNVGTLFEGMPEDMALGECARIKAARGDKLAIAVLKQLGIEA